MIVATICISESKRCLYKSIEKDERTAKIQDIVIIDWCLVELPHIKSIHFLDLLKCKLLGAVAPLGHAMSLSRSVSIFKIWSLNCLFKRI